MKQIKISTRHEESQIELSADSLEEINELLDKLPEVISKLDSVKEQLVAKVGDVDLKGIVKVDEKGLPVLSGLHREVTDKEAIMLLLYPLKEEGLKSGDIGMLLNKSGIVSTGYAARLYEMRREGIVTKKETGEYILTEKGKVLARELAKKLRGVVVQQ
ncbi:MAG: hypothetical protein ACP5KW_01960 [Thermoproteota archaeon]|jgi:predicted transcriptional regulator|nr:hypothetical protein [Nitrososphaerota archaeon]